MSGSPFFQNFGIDPVAREKTADLTKTYGDDYGLQLNGQLAIGNKTQGYEMIVGQGDSYAPEIAFHFNGSTYTDITDILGSDTSSTTGVFGGTTAGNILYIGADQKFYGLKVKIVTAGTAEPDNIVAEYWDQDTTSWVQTNFMVSDSSYPFNTYAKDISGCGDNCSVQWRFDFDPNLLDPFWDKNTINGVEKYWGRFRIVTDITSDPVVEQMKCHSSRWECNDNGSTEYFGYARYPRTLQAGLDKLIPNSLSTPANQSVTYGSTLTMSYTNNKFAHTARDGFGMVQNIIEGIDTSIVLRLDVSYYVDGAQTGDIELQSDMYVVKDGFTYNGTGVPINKKVVDSVTVASDQVRRTSSMFLDVSSLTDDDAIVVDIFRDGGVGNDTLSQAIVITNVRLTGWTWKP